MSGQTSEEKTLPASEKKLQDARKKGQIAKSQDVISAVTMVVLTLYLIIAWPQIFDAFGRMFDSAGKAASQLGPNAWVGATRDTWDAMSDILMPLYALAVLAIFIGSLISNKGIVIAMEPITPNFSKINPAEGFKRIFGMRNLIEFIKALVKSFLLLGALALAGWLGLKAMMQAPLCGEDCSAWVLTIVAAPVVFAALTLFVLSGVIDATVQRWLFNREMRMTHSEFKREIKDMLGDPQIRGARKDIQRAEIDGAVGRATRYVSKDRTPTLIIASDRSIAIALRYAAGETPAPVIVARSVGPNAAILIEEAQTMRLPVVNEPDIAKELLRRGKTDSFIPEAYFKDIARIMSQLYDD